MSNLATIVNNILADSGIDDINVVVTTGSYNNPAWITGLSWSKISSTPTTLSGYGITDAVPAIRTITINGTAQDLSANRSWSVGTVTSVDMTVPTGFAISGRPITSSGTLALTFAAGYSLPSNSTQGVWNIAYSRSLTAASVTGTTTKTLTLTQQDGSTLTASWTDYDTAPVTSVNAGTGISVNSTTGAVTVTNTGVLSINGSTGAVTGIITTSNYNLYSPTLTGGGASGTWGINITGSATQFNGLNFNGVTSRFQADLNTLGLASTSGIYNIGAGYTNGPAGDLYGTLFGIWNSDISVQFWATYNGDFYWRKSVGSTYAGSTWRTILDSSNFGSYAVPIRGVTNWNDGTVLNYVIGMLGWKNYGGNHVIFDASASTSPSGVSISNTNAQNAWTGTYPTLMGWNGSQTYGVRVDSARVSDNTSGNSATTSQTNFTALTINSAAVATQSWVNSQGFVTGGPYLALSGGTVTGPVYMTGGSSTTPNLTVDRNIAAPANYYTGLQLEVRATSGTAGIALHRNGFSHVGIYHDSSNELKFNMNAGTPVLGAGVGTIIGSGNYNSYAPTLTGGGASGTWGINVTGSSGSTGTLLLTGLGNGTVNVNNPNTAVYRNENGLGAAVAYAPLLHLGGGDTMWQIQGTYGSSGSGVLYFRQGYNGSWGTWLTMLSSSNYNNYSPTLTGGGASGTWGINVTGTAASETLATVVARGNSTGGGRPIVLDNGGGAIITTANAGGWSMGTYYKGSGGTTLAGFGAYGGFDSLTYAWIGPGYEAPWMTINSGATVLNTSLTVNGVWSTTISTSGGWNKLSFVASNAWGDGVTYGVLGASGGTEPGVMINNPHIVWNAGNAAACIRLGRSGGVSTGAWYQVATMSGDEFMIAKNGVWSNGGLKIASNGLLYYGETGHQFVYNTGTWGISISGNAATATNSSQVGGVSVDRIVYGSNSTKSTGFDGGDINAALACGFYDGYGMTGAPTGSTYYHLIASRHQNTSNNYQMQFAGNFFNSGLIYYRIISNGTASAWGQVWTSQNDGAGSGLDADLLDGYQSATAATANTIPIRDASGDITVRELVLNVAVQDFTPSSMVAIYPTTNQAVKVTASGARNFLDVPTRGGSGASGTWGINISAPSTVSSPTFYNGRYSEWSCGDAVAPGPGANRYEIARIGIDFNDWNGVGTFEVDLQEIYYYAGGRKRYVISYGYGGPVISCSLVELNGVASQGNFRVVVGPEVVVSGDWRYLPVFVEIQYYTQVAVKVRTTRNITNSTVPEVGYAKVFTSPSGTGIGGFSVDNTVYPTSGQADISNPILRATSNLVTPTIYSGGGNVTFGNNIGLDGSNAQIQFNAAASADLYLSCIPGTRTMQIRNGNSGSPNYSACGLVTGTVDLTHYLQLSSDRVTQSNGHVGYFVSTQYSSTNYIPFSFESQYGTHSWGGVARFHIQQSGADRPSITFSSGSSNDRWSVGFCTGSDNNFRITQNMGMRPDGSGNNDGWGTQRMLINTSGNTTFSGTVTATAFFESSDRRIKDLIQDNYRVNDIETIRPKLYKKNGKIELGYYAQDIESIFSHAISVNDDGFLNLSYREVHTAKIAYLEDSIEEIKAKILYLENQLKTKQ